LVGNPTFSISRINKPIQPISSPYINQLFYLVAPRSSLDLAPGRGSSAVLGGLEPHRWTQRVAGRVARRGKLRGVVAVMERKDCRDLPGFSFLRCFNYSMLTIYTMYIYIYTCIYILYVLAIVYSIYYIYMRNSKQPRKDWPIGQAHLMQRSGTFYPLKTLVKYWISSVDPMASILYYNI